MATRRSTAGFTLLEVLIAVSIAALLVTAAVQSYLDISKAQQKGLEQNGRDRIAVLALDRIERELVGTVLVVKPKETPLEDHPWEFIGFDAVREAHDADALLFVTENPSSTAGNLAAQDARLIAYQVGPGELPEQLNVYRTEVGLPDKLKRELPPLEGAPVIEGVAQFGITYRDEESGAEAAVWDSTAGQQASKLPGAVELKLQLYSQSPEGEQVPGELFTRLVPLPVRPIGEGEEGDCEFSTISECLLGIGLDAANLEQLLQGLAVNSSECFTPDDPKLSGMLATLKDVLPNPAEACKKK
jgi:type II secretion system protein J